MGLCPSYFFHVFASEFSGDLWAELTYGCIHTVSFEYFKKSGHDLNVHVAYLLSDILVHVYIPDHLSVSTIIPITKGKNSNVTDSANCILFIYLFISLLVLYTAHMC